jgi:hypothetical protein
MPEVIERRLKEPQPILMSLVRRKHRLQVRLESVDGKQDPFCAINTKTNQLINLQQRERLSAYSLLQITPPKDLIRSVRISQIIRQRKTPQRQEQSLIETS